MDSTPVTAAVQAVQSNSSDPLLGGIAFVLAVVIGLIAIAKPLMGLYREYKKTGSEGTKAEAESAKSTAETFLYQQLQQQIESNTKAIDKLQTERDRWFEKAVLLEREVNKLKSFEQMVDAMKVRIDEKDRVIAQREDEIRGLTRNILDMKDRLHILEMRLTLDEHRICEHCQADLFTKEQNGTSSYP